MKNKDIKSIEIINTKNNRLYGVVYINKIYSKPSFINKQTGLISNKDKEE